MPVLPTRDFPAGLTALGELALDLRWTWSHETDALWERVDPEVWGRTRNPWIILQDILAEGLRALAADASFVPELERLARARRAYLDTPGWFFSAHGAAALSGMAYFGMEFGLDEGLPLYAGGLGILAGDFVKTASDLGIPAQPGVVAFAPRLPAEGIVAVDLGQCEIVAPRSLVPRQPPRRHRDARYRRDDE